VKGYQERREFRVQRANELGQQTSKQTNRLLHFLHNDFLNSPFHIGIFHNTNVIQKTQGVLMDYKNDLIFKIRYFFVTSEPIFINIRK
jgi:hypothetical protein